MRFTIDKDQFSKRPINRWTFHRKQESESDVSLLQTRTDLPRP
jgi:hypothetical protein